MKTAQQRGARRPEHDHERGVLGPFYSGMGITVNCTSARVHAKGVTPGMPDLVLQWEQLGGTLYHESKIDTRQTKAQYDFEFRAVTCGTPYILGDVTSAFDFVEWLGIAWRVGETVRFYPKHEWAGRITDSVQPVPDRPDVLRTEFDWRRIARKWALSDANRKHHQQWGYRE